LVVGLDHRILPARRRLHRQPVQQGRVRQDHPARMHRDPPRQRVQAFGQLPQRTVRAGVGSQLPQLGQFLERSAYVAGADVWEGLGRRACRARRSERNRSLPTTEVTGTALIWGFAWRDVPRGVMGAVSSRRLCTVTDHLELLPEPLGDGPYSPIGKYGPMELHSASVSCTRVTQEDLPDQDSAARTNAAD